MRKIKYNISDHAEINWKKTLLSTLSIFFLSILLILAGILMIINNRTELKENLTTLNNTENELESILKKEQEWEKEILKKRKIWRKEITFINELIDESTRPIVSNMSLLEGILPDAVYIKELALSKSGKDSGIIVKVSSDQFSDLYNFYNKLKKLKDELTYNISSEEFSDFENISTIKIIFKNDEIQSN